MKKFGLIVLCSLTLLSSFSALAKRYVYTGDNYRSYAKNIRGEIEKEAFTSYVDYKIIIDTDVNLVSVTVADEDAMYFTIIRQEPSKDPYKGTYIYCTSNITLNVYTDSNNTKHLIMDAPKVISVFDI